MKNQYKVARTKGLLLAIFKEGRQGAVCVFTVGETDETRDLPNAEKYARKIAALLNASETP